jgi:hypothetical protein
VLCDQHLGNRRASVVKLSGTVRGLAEQHHAIMSETFGEARKLSEIAERLSSFGDEAADLGADDSRALRRDEQPVGETRGPCVDPGRLRLLWLDPAFGADQRHEGDGAVILLLERVFVDATHQQQRLVNIATDRNDEPPARRQLLLQGLGHSRTAGRNQDRVEWRLFRQALGAVGADK